MNVFLFVNSSRKEEKNKKFDMQGTHSYAHTPPYLFTFICECVNWTKVFFI